MVATSDTATAAAAATSVATAEVSSSRPDATAAAAATPLLSDAFSLFGLSSTESTAGLGAAAASFDFVIFLGSADPAATGFLVPGRVEPTPGLDTPGLEAAVGLAPGPDLEPAAPARAAATREVAEEVVLADVAFAEEAVELDDEGLLVAPAVLLAAKPEVLVAVDDVVRLAVVEPFVMGFFTPVVVVPFVVGLVVVLLAVAVAVLVVPFAVGLDAVDLVVVVVVVFAPAVVLVVDVLAVVAEEVVLAVFAFAEAVGLGEGVTLVTVGLGALPGRDAVVAEAGREDGAAVGRLEVAAVAAGAAPGFLAPAVAPGRVLEGAAVPVTPGTVGFLVAVDPTVVRVVVVVVGLLVPAAAVLLAAVVGLVGAVRDVAVVLVGATLDLVADALAPAGFLSGGPRGLLNGAGAPFLPGVVSFFTSTFFFSSTISATGGVSILAGSRVISKTFSDAPPFSRANESETATIADFTSSTFSVASCISFLVSSMTVGSTFDSTRLGS